MRFLQTNRLLLRPFQMADLNDFYAYAKHPEVGPNAGWKPHASIDESREILKTFLRNEEISAIVLKETGRVVGSIGLHSDRLSHEGMGPCREIGYVLARQCWGRGLMTEAVRRLQKYAFEEMGLALLTVAHFPFNTRSSRVIEKCGFRYEKTLPGAYIDYRGIALDEVCYIMTREDYTNLLYEKLNG
ncbi:MAG: N-acetyltransferase domain-containing protein [Oscillospiraceae bacterium]|jgi:[ribosomal protein S5]-alanine N-acetyltransferase